MHFSTHLHFFTTALVLASSLANAHSSEDRETSHHSEDTHHDMMSTHHSEMMYSILPYYSHHTDHHSDHHRHTYMMSGSYSGCDYAQTSRFSQYTKCASSLYSAYSTQGCSDMECNCKSVQEIASCWHDFCPEHDMYHGQVSAFCGTSTTTAASASASTTGTGTTVTAAATTGGSGSSTTTASATTTGASGSAAAASALSSSTSTSLGGASDVVMPAGGVAGAVIGLLAYLL